MAAATGQSIETVRRVLRSWVAAGAVGRETAHVGGYVRYTFFGAPEAAPGAAGQRPMSPEQAMWTAMWMMTTFNPIDIAIHATAPERPVSTVMARDYCRALSRIGYLKVTRTAVPGKREASYRLLRKTGPVAPAIRRVRGVWDANCSAFLMLGEVQS